MKNCWFQLLEYFDHTGMLNYYYRLSSSPMSSLTARRNATAPLTTIIVFVDDKGISSLSTI
jgi:hypothetical protein